MLVRCSLYVHLIESPTKQCYLLDFFEIKKPRYAQLLRNAYLVDFFEINKHRLSRYTSM